MDDAAVKQARILIVDDQQANITLLARLLDVSGFTNVSSTTDSSQALALCAELDPDLVLLDLQMPDPDGFAVMDMLRPWTTGPARLPILVLTADSTSEAKRRALVAGASDFLSKPFDTTEAVLRIKNLLMTRLLQLELRDQNKLLEQRVRDRTRELDEARIEVVERLALTAEYRDDTTGEHCQRVGQLSALLAQKLGLPDADVELIRRAAMLHDVGKVGLSDAILLKEGALTPEEREVVKLHVAIGAEILGRSRSRLLQMAEEIALTHHERWDGTGYLSGSKGEDIPIVGRIVAVADAFDALTSRRPYKKASSSEDALAEMRKHSGRQFDPAVVEALTALGSAAAETTEPKLELVA